MLLTHNLYCCSELRHFLGLDLDILGTRFPKHLWLKGLQTSSLLCTPLPLIKTNVVLWFYKKCNYKMAPTIWKVDHYKSGHFWTDFKWFWQNSELVFRFWMVDFRSHSNFRPFANQPLFDHSKSGTVLISNPHCLQIKYMFRLWFQKFKI